MEQWQPWRDDAAVETLDNVEDRDEEEDAGESRAQCWTL